MLNRTLFGLAIFLVSKFVFSQGIFLNNDPHNVIKRTPAEQQACIKRTDSYGGEDTLCISTSPNIEKQIAVINKTGESVLLIDPNSQRYGLLRNNGSGVIIDEGADLIYIIVVAGVWEGKYETVQSLKFPEILSRHAPMDIDATTNSSANLRMLPEILSDFGFDVAEVPEKSPGGIVNFIREKFKALIETLTTVLANVVDYSFNGWNVLKYGLTHFFNVFKWLGKFVSAVYGGVSTLLEKAVKIPLELIMTAKDGVQALIALLKHLVDKFDFTETLKSIINIPQRLLSYVAGLGGNVLRGNTGVYEIISNIVNLLKMAIMGPAKAISSAIISSIEHISDLIMGYFKKTPEEDQSIPLQLAEFRSIVDEQDKKYSNRDGLRNLVDVIQAPTTDGTLLIEGVDITPCFKILTDPSFKSSIDSSVALFTQLRSVLSMDIALPSLVHSTLRKLNSPTGLNELKEVVPDLDINAGMTTGMRVLPTEESKNLSTTELLKTFPVAQQILEKYEKAAETHAGIKVADTLKVDQLANTKLRDSLIMYGSY